jgi:type I restriction enzyme R subunit
MADEAHRSEYGQFARNVTAALPNAVRIGFTGTPIEQGDKSTRTTFGDYISIYRMSQAQEDGATVPIYYESRQIPVAVSDPEELRKVEDVLEGEEEAAAAKLITSWAKLEKLVGAADRLNTVADDITDHHRKRCQTLTGKAMVVGYSRRICAELAERLQQRLGEETVTCVMTAQATDDPAISKWRRSSHEMRQVESDFKDPDHPLRVVVVRDMWLTGFDVPALHTLYIDKPMRDHGLLQAIARVNRVFKDKPGGLVVDYIGIGDDLRASLTAYSKNDVDAVVIPLAQAVSKLREKHEILCDLVHGIEFRPRDGMSAGEKATLFNQAVLEATDRFLETDEKTRGFLDQQMAFSKWFALVSPDAAAVELSYDASLFAAVAKQLRKVTVTASQASKAAEQAVKQFFAEGLSAGEVVDVFALADEDRPEFSVLSDEFLDGIAGIKQPNVQVALLRKLLNDELKARMRSNRIQAKQFSDEIEAVIGRYQQKQLTSAEVVQALVAVAKKLREAKRRNEELGLSEEEASFYDALAGHADDWKADPKLAEIAHDLVKSIKADLSVDWTDRKNTEAQIRTKIKRLLRKHEYKPPAENGGAGGKGLDDATQLVLEQARVLYRYWPDYEVGGALFAEEERI